MKITVGLVDDHQLFIKSLEMMLNSFRNFTVVVDALNGEELQSKIKLLPSPPDIMLIDVSMPKMNGPETARWLREHYSTIKVAALSMNDKESSIIDMIRSGCCAYLFKDSHPNELEHALNEIYQKGYFNSGATAINYAKLFAHYEKETITIADREKEFLVHACTDLTYKQIASLMKVSERTIDGYRENLFQKLRVQSRTGMALEAVRRGLVNL